MPAERFDRKVAASTWLRSVRVLRALTPSSLDKIFFRVNHYEAEQRINSRLFFSLGSEGRKHFLQSYHHADLSAISFQEFHEYCVLLFRKEKNYIIEFLQIYNAVHAERERLEVFYLRLTGPVALCGWTIDQEKEVVRDIFITKMRYKDIQRELCIRPRTTPEVTLKSALLQEKGAQTATNLQKQNSSGVRQHRAISPIKGPIWLRVHASSRNRSFLCKGKS